MQKILHIRFAPVNKRPVIVFFAKITFSQKVWHTIYTTEGRLKKINVKKISMNETGFPKGLLAGTAKEIFFAGDISLLSGAVPVVAVIGRRDTSPAAAKNARRCGEIAAECGYIVLNGLAIGCDTKALEGALSAGGRCVAVLPCGLDRICPKSNIALAEKIVQKGGCLVTEYPSGTAPEKWRFVARDKIQAQLADKILVVDCEEKSGTMYAVREGARIGKKLGCIAGSSGISSGNRYIAEHIGAESIKGEKTLKKFLEK